MSLSLIKKCLDSGFVPSWLTKGNTVLLMKDQSKGNIASNYRPITYLFAINMGVIVGCNCRSDLWTFRSTEV